jgi:hypothetical protein
MPAVRRPTALLTALIAVLAVAGPAHAAPPPIKHVFIIWMENKDYADTFAKENPKAPYLARELPKMGALLPNYYGIGHHSLTNYIAVISGQGPNPNTQADAPVYHDVMPGNIGADGQAMGLGSVYPATVKTITNQLEAKDLTWKGYMEDMALGTPKDCRHPPVNGEDDTQSARAGDQYATKHNPFVYFHSIIDTPSCAKNDVDLNQLPGDMADVSSTANYIFITPDLCSDGHDEPCIDGRPGGLKSIDDFLKEWVPKILDSPGYKDDGLLVVSFDEAEHDDTACCGERAANTPAAGAESGGPGGGKTGAVLISPFIKPGTVDETDYNHYSFLRWTQDLFGLKPYLGYAADAGLKTMGDKTFTQPTPELTAKIAAQRVGGRRVRFTVDAGRKAEVAFSGTCAAKAQPTDEAGKLVATIGHSRRGSCRVTVSRPNWQAAKRGFKLRRPR